MLVDSPDFAKEINTSVRDVDITHSRQFQLSDVQGFGSSLWDINSRNPLTIAAEIAGEI